MFRGQIDQGVAILNRLIDEVNGIETKGATKFSSSEYRLPIASPTTLGGVKIGSNLNISETGVLSAPNTGTTDYDALSNKPEINSVVLQGDKSLPDLDVTPLSNFDIDNLINNT